MGWTLRLKKRKWKRGRRVRRPLWECGQEGRAASTRGVALEVEADEGLGIWWEWEGKEE